MSIWAFCQEATWKNKKPAVGDHLTSGRKNRKPVSVQLTGFQQVPIFLRVTPRLIVLQRKSMWLQSFVKNCNPCNGNNFKVHLCARLNPAPWASASVLKHATFKNV